MMCLKYIYLFASITLLVSLASGNTSGCGEDKVARKGSIQSPGYPVNYGISNCKWTVTPQDGKRVWLKWVSLDIDNTGDCFRARVSIYNDDRLIGTYCGSKKPHNFLGNGKMTIEFVASSSGVNRKGFKIEFEQIIFEAGGSTWRPPPVTTRPVTTRPPPATTRPVTTRPPPATTRPVTTRQPPATTRPVTTRQPPVTTRPPPVTTRPPLKCGDPTISLLTNNRIVGGGKAAEGSWPHIVDVRYNSRPFCAATIINPQWLVSAAHCFGGAVGNFKMIAGKYKKNENGDQTKGVAKIFIHENYDSRKFDNDIALIKLTEPFTFNERVSPVCLPENGDAADAANCYVAGWGATKGTGHDDVLKQAIVPIVNRKLCNTPDYYSNRITENMICAGYDEGGHDACQGDSGGPLICKMDGRWELQGIVSWGFGCAGEKKPGVYTRVPNYTAWIEKTIEDEEKLID